MEIEKLGFITNSKFGAFHLCYAFGCVYDAYKVSCWLDYILMCFDAWNDKMQIFPPLEALGLGDENWGFCGFWYFDVLNMLSSS